MTALTASSALPLAALLHSDDNHDMDALLERVARRLMAEGWRVGGLVFRMDRYANGNKCMRLFDLRSDARFELSQDLGAASEACSLNPQAIAQASAVLRQALADGVQLVLINRFGQVEALGGGFAHEFAACLESGVPVLTAVAARHAAEWQRFTGGAHTPLADDEAAVYAWCVQQLQAVQAGQVAP